MKMGTSKQHSHNRAVVSCETLGQNQMLTRHDRRGNIRYLITFIPFQDFISLYSANTEASACLGGTWYEFRSIGQENVAYCRADRSTIHFHLATDDSSPKGNQVLKFECGGEILGSMCVAEHSVRDFFETEENFWCFTRNASKMIGKLNCSKNSAAGKLLCELPDILVMPNHSMYFDSSLVQLH